MMRLMKNFGRANIQIYNPFRMNDWPTKRFIISVLSLQISLSGLICLDALNLGIPMLRQFVGFIFLTFIPGFIILRILRLYDIGLIKSVLFSVGLSLSFLMLMGLFMNTFYPVIGISKPISIISLIITMNVFVIFLLILSYLRDGSSFSDVKLNISELFEPHNLSLLLLPFLAIFGAYLVQFHDNNLLLLFLLVSISLIPIFVAIDKVSHNIYPLLIFIIAISLIYHKILSSMYIQGSDLHVEYYFANQVKTNFYWNPAIPTNINCMLGSVMLAPILSAISSLSLTWTFKLFYSFFFSLVPLALYQVYKEQTNAKIAFFASFFFMSLFGFYSQSLLSNAKQMMAEFFLVLLLLLIISKNMDTIKGTILAIIFSFSLIVSHYGSTYILILMLVFVWSSIQVYNKINKKIVNINIIKYNFILLFTVTALAWYLYTASSSPFLSIVRIGDHIINSIFTEFLNRTEGGVIYWITRELPLSWKILRILNYISQFFIIIGISHITYSKFRNREAFNVRVEYAFFAIAALAGLLSSIVTPGSVGRGTMDIQRVYQLTLIFLAPFGIIGGLRTINIISNLISKSVHAKKEIGRSKEFKFLAAFFTAFLLFNSGFVAEIIQEMHGGDYCSSESISQARIKESGSVDEKIMYYGTNYPEEDIYSAKWLGQYRVDDLKIFVDSCSSSHILLSYGMVRGGVYRSCTYYTEFPTRDINSYIYIRKINYIDNIIQVDYWMQQSMQEKLGYSVKSWNTSELLPTLEEKKAKIYTNGASIIYR